MIESLTVTEKIKAYREWAQFGFFSEDRKVVKLADSTVDQYCHYIALFLDWLKKHEIDVSNCNEEMIQKYLNSSNLNSHNNFVAIASYLQFLDFPIRIRKKIPAQRKKSRRKPILNENIISEIMAKVPEEHKKLYAVLASSGIRVSEAYWLRYCDVYSVDDLVVFNIQQAKGGGTRQAVIVPFFSFSQYAESVLAEWNSTRYVFRRYWDTPERIKNAIQYQSRKINIHYSAHSFRHFFARSCLENHLSLSDVQHFLGHRSLRTTFTYLSSNFEIACNNLQKLYWKKTKKFYTI